MQLLKGHHVYNALQETTDPQLRQVVDEQNNMIFKCKVVFPNLFDIRDIAPSGVPRARAKKVSKHQAVSEEAKQMVNYSRAQQRLKEVNFLRAELEVFHQVFKKEFDKTYEKAKKTYDAANKPALDAYYLAVETAKNTWCANRPVGEYNHEDPCHQPPTVPYPSLPAFEFDLQPDLTNDNLSKNLSDPALTILYGLLKDSTTAKQKMKINETNIDDLFEDIETFEDLFEIISKAQAKAEKVKPAQISVEEPGRRLVEINGVYMPVSLRTNQIQYTLSFSTIGSSTGLEYLDNPFTPDNQTGGNPINNHTDPYIRIQLQLFNTNGLSIQADETSFNATIHSESLDAQSIITQGGQSIQNINFYPQLRQSDFQGMTYFRGQIKFTNGQTAILDDVIIHAHTDTYTGNLNLDANSTQIAPPSNLSVVLTTANTAELSWDAVPGAAAYDIEYSIINTSSWTSFYADTNNFLIENLTASTTYQARVRSRYIDANGAESFSGFSDPINLVTKANNNGILSAPTNLTHTNLTNTSLTLNWDAVANAVSYDVYQNGVFKANVSTNTAAITGLLAGTGYTFAVRAKNATGTLSASTQITIKTTGAASGSTGSTPTTPTQTAFVPSGFGIKQLGIADYDKVEQSTYCYIEGDVAHIENIMAREFREKTTTRFRSQSTETSDSFESESEQLTDTTSVDRFEMQSEVAKVIAQSRDMQASTSFSAHTDMYKVKLAASASGGIATHNSSEVSTRQAITQAKEITERAMDRVVTKVKRERVEKILDEFTEVNSHGFDNRKGDQHVVGVYRWVDKIIKNQIYTYGKRQMMEFMIPEPARLHTLAIESAVKKGARTLTEPLDPRKATLNKMEKFTDATDGLIAYWASKYNAEVPKKKKDTIWIGTSFDYKEDVVKNNTEELATGSINLEIPNGYFTTHAKTEFHHSDDGYGPGEGNWFNSLTQVIVGNDKLITYNHTPINQLKPINPYVGTIPISYSQGGYLVSSVNISVECQLTQEAKAEYQLECFNKIISAYERALADYNSQVGNIKGSNPGFYRQIENTVLRQNCIAYMVEQNPNTLLTLGSKGFIKSIHPTDATINHVNFGVNQTSDLDKYAAFVKFFEQAFEWDIMSYYFYPYYWGGRDQWASTYDFEDNDPLFRSFMQSGMARVIVTVRPGFEDMVSFYMKTGLIWNGGEVPTIGEDTYLSLAQEMMKPLGEKKGKPWRQRLPTPLTILQAESIGLEVEKALPCVGCDDNETYEDNLGSFCNSNPEFGFTKPNALIGGAQETTKPVEKQEEQAEAQAKPVQELNP